MLLPNRLPEAENLVDYREAARLAGLRPTDVLRLRREGLFPDWLGCEIEGVRYLLFRRSSVEKWVAAGRPRVSPGREADWVVNVPADAGQEGIEC